MLQKWISKSETKSQLMHIKFGMLREEISSLQFQKSLLLLRRPTINMFVVSNFLSHYSTNIKSFYIVWKCQWKEIACHFACVHSKSCWVILQFSLPHLALYINNFLFFYKFEMYYLHLSFCLAKNIYFNF